MFPVLVATQRLAHVECILTFTGGTVIVVADNASENGVAAHHVSIHTSLGHFVIAVHSPEMLIHLDGDLVRHPDIQIHEPSIVVVCDVLQLFDQAGCVATSAPAGSNGQHGDVCMPGREVFRAAHFRRRLLELAHDCNSLASDTFQTVKTEVHTVGYQAVSLVLEDLEQRRPFLHVCQVEGDVIVLGQWVQVGLVHAQ